MNDIIPSATHQLGIYLFDAIENPGNKYDKLKSSCPFWDVVFMFISRYKIAITGAMIKNLTIIGLFWGQYLMKKIVIRELTAEEIPSKGKEKIIFHITKLKDRFS